MSLIKYSPDVANVAASGLKGFCDQAGISFNPNYLIYVLGVGALFNGFRRGRNTLRRNENPIAAMQDVDRACEKCDQALAEGDYRKLAKSFDDVEGKTPAVEAGKGFATQFTLGTVEMIAGYFAGALAHTVFT